MVLKKITKYKQLLPILFLSFYGLVTILYWINGEIVVDGIVYPFSPSVENYVSFTVLIVNYLVFFLIPKFFKHTLIVTLMLGIFNIIVFTTFKESISMNLNGGSEGVGFQLVAVTALILTYFVNFRRVNNFMLYK